MSRTTVTLTLDSPPHVHAVQHENLGSVGLTFFDAAATLYMTTDAARATAERILALIDGSVTDGVVVDSDTGERLTDPMPIEDAEAIASAPSAVGRNVHVEAVA